MGVAVPLPGSLTFHFTFSVSLHVTGGVAEALVPFANGPRHWGQLSPGADAPTKATFPPAVSTAVAARSWNERITQPVAVLRWKRKSETRVSIITRKDFASLIPVLPPHGHFCWAR